MKLNIPVYLRNIKFEYKITLTYFIFGFLWILFSDKLLELLVSDNSLLTEFQTFKGSFFIIVTSGFLFLLVKSHMIKLRIVDSKLIESEFRFNRLYENGPFGMVMADNEFRFKLANPAFCKIMGYDEAEIRKKTFKDITHPDDLNRDLINVQKLMQMELTVYKTEKRYIRKDGQMVWGSLTVTTTYNNEGKFLYYLGIIEDITEKKLAVEKIREKDLEFRKLSANVPGLIFQFTRRPDGSYFVPIASKGIFNIFGCTPEDVLDDFAPISRVIYPEDTERVIYDIEYSAKHLTYFTCEFRVQIPDREIQWIYSNSAPEKLPDGSVTWYGFNTDITDRKKAEDKIRRLNEELEDRIAERTAQLLESNKELESFAYSVSHDLRAPLRHVIGFSEKLDSELKGKGDLEITRLTGKIKSSASKMSRLIDELLTYSRLGRTDLKSINLSLNAYIDEIIKQAADITKGRNIEWNIHQFPAVSADPTLIKLVLQNLILNSIKFTAKKQNAIIEIGYEEKNEKGYIFFIKDNGAGFNMHYANKLFGVFQRLHTTEEFEGTGIGLATVRRIILRHKGSVWAEGIENEGATFFFSLPK